MPESIYINLHLNAARRIKCVQYIFTFPILRFYYETRTFLDIHQLIFFIKGSRIKRSLLEMRNRQQKRGQKKKRQSNGGFPKKYLELGLIGDNHFVEKLGDDKATKLLLLNAHIVSSNSKYLFNPQTSKRGGGGGQMDSQRFFRPKIWSFQAIKMKLSVSSLIMSASFDINWMMLKL